MANLPLDRGEVGLPVRIPDVDANPGTEVGRLGLAVNRMLDHIATALSTRQAGEVGCGSSSPTPAMNSDPLAAIRGYTELASKLGNGLKCPPDVAHAMSRVESEADRMTRLVEDLLLLARLDSGRPLEHHPVDLSRLCADVIGDAHAAGPEHRWNLEVPAEPVLVIGDDARLHQVVANLLANARVHTPAGTAVTLSLRPRPGAAMLRVADDGPGSRPNCSPRSSSGSPAATVRVRTRTVPPIWDWPSCKRWCEPMAAASGAQCAGHTEFTVYLPATRCTAYR